MARGARRGRQSLIPALRQLVASNDLSVAVAVVGRFYGDGLTWALGLPLPDLIRWHGLRETVRKAEHGD